MTPELIEKTRLIAEYAELGGKSILKYHESFDWQNKVWVKVVKEGEFMLSDRCAVNADAEYRSLAADFLVLRHRYSCAFDTRNPEAGFNILYEAIVFLNNNKG